MSRTNSQLARSLAGQQGWGNINSCRSITPGVWHADCAGHGGLLTPLANVDDSITADALRALRVVWTVWQIPGRKPYWDSPGSTWYGDQIRNGSGATSAEWVVGEEDCNWALVVAAVPSVAAVLPNPDTAISDAIQSIDTWHDDTATVTYGVGRWSARSVLIDRLAGRVAS